MIDLLVVGGGPIGLAAAIEARLAGLTVTVIEPREGVIDKACGEGLMPGALAALQRIGVDPAGHPINGISYLDNARSVTHKFRVAPGRGVRRTVLHRALLERSDQLGVERVHHKVSSFDQDADSVTVGFGKLSLRASWMLGCDGLHSTVRELAGLAVATRGVRRFGIRRHFEIAPWSDLVEVYWAKGPGVEAEIYVTPVGPSEVGVAVLGTRQTDYGAAVSSVSALADRLEGFRRTSGPRGAGPLLQRTRARTAGRVLLVGDASGYVDAITGEGVRVGLAQANAAIRCIVSGEPRRYEKEWRRVTREFRILTLGLIRLGESPLRSAIVPAAAKLPLLYGNIVERLAR